MAVVKADGYGHGALPVAQAALAAGAKRLGVARVTEGLALRAGGVTAPILVLSIALPAEIPKAVRADLTLTPHNVETLATAAAAARARGRPAPVHIKVDTGMGRFGLSPPDAMRIAAQAAADPNIELEGLYSHLAARRRAGLCCQLRSICALPPVRPGCRSSPPTRLARVQYRRTAPLPRRCTSVWCGLVSGSTACLPPRADRGRRLAPRYGAQVGDRSSVPAGNR